jgi:hypothetical protein
VSTATFSVIVICTMTDINTAVWSWGMGEPPRVAELRLLVSNGYLFRCICVLCLVLAKFAAGRLDIILSRAWLSPSVVGRRCFDRVAEYVRRISPLFDMGGSRYGRAISTLVCSFFY